MIPILISLAKRLTSNIIGWFKRNYKAMAVIIITILAAICFYQNNQLDKKNKEIDRVTNNYLYYEQLATQQKNDNRVLQLTLDEFKETKDSLIQEVHATVKKLKIKEKELKQVQIQEQKVVHDTTIVVRSTDFKVEIKPNNLTSIVINKRDTLLTHSIDIRNTQSLFIHTKKEYKRNYKNWFQRLLHFDFKKRTIYKYQIDNSNKLINVENTRIIDLSNATNKEEIANMVRQNYNEFKAKKEAASKYDEEMEKCKDILDQLEAQVEIPTVTNTVDNSKEINDLKNDVADIRKMIEDAKTMFMGGFPKPPMPPMPNVPAPQMK